MSDTTEIFHRIPSDAGVTFEGFENVKIPSREAVRRKLEEFVQVGRSSSKPAIRILLGEWGEGKTDAFTRYLKPTLEAQGDYAFRVSASTVSNSYSLPNVAALVQSSPVSAVRFLVALFHSIGEEGRVKEISRLGPQKDAQQYLDEVFGNLLESKVKRHIFIFIDEFEELLTNKERLNEIISGVKETVNGLYKEVNEGGRYAGRLHLILAATPDAYYQLQTKEDTALIFGGLGRRGPVIELPAIRKEEGLHFLFELLKYSYEGKPPKVLPFQNSGVFQAIFRIAQGNPGNMVSLFTHAMVSAKADASTMRVIGHGEFLQFLENEKVSIYGGTTSCLETDTYSRMIDTLSDQQNSTLAEKSISVFQLMLGAPKAYEEAELSSLAGRSDVHNIVNGINDLLRSKYGIPRTVLKLSPLRTGKTLNDVTDAFKDFITTEKDEKLIRIENYSEPLKAFQDRLAYFETKGGKPGVVNCLPADTQSALNFFEGIDEDRAGEITRMTKKKLCDDRELFACSDQVLDQVYPAPVPRELEFITNRQTRLKLWRDVTRNLTDYFESYMPQAFISLNSRAGIFTSENTGVALRIQNAEIDAVKFGDFTFRVLYHAINGEFSGSDVDRLHSAYKSTSPPVHLIVVAYSGEKTQQVDDKISFKGMGPDQSNLILEFRIHPTLAKRIISVYRANLEYKDEINPESLAMTVQRMASQDLGLAERLTEWLGQQRTTGRVIGNLDLKATTDVPLVAKTVRFFIDTTGSPDTLDEVFRRSNLIDGFFRYDAKARLAPDIELPKFSEIAEDLAANGFVQRQGVKYSVQSHPVELRILELLEQHQKLSEAQVGEYFILQSPRLLKDVFLPILLDKGAAGEAGTSFTFSIRSEVVAQMEEPYATFTRIAGAPGRSEYGYVFMVKKRGTRLITLPEFLEYVSQLHAQIRRADSPDNVVLSKVALLDKLLNHFTEEFVPLFESAKSQSDSIYLASVPRFDQFSRRLTEFKEASLKWLKMNVNEFAELSEANRLYQEIGNARKLQENDIRKLTEKWIREESDALKTFEFRSEDKAAYFFNPKFYAVSQAVAAFTSYLDLNERYLQQAAQVFESFEENQRRIDGQLAAMVLSENAQLSKKILRSLRKLNTDLLSDIEHVDRQTVSLPELIKNMSLSRENIDERLDAIKGSIGLLDDLVNNEESLASVLETGKQGLEKATAIFDLAEYHATVEAFGKTIALAERELQELISTAEIRDLSQISQTVKGFRQQLALIEQSVSAGLPKLEEAWRDYRDGIEEYVSTVEVVFASIEKRYEVSREDLNPRLDAIKAEIKSDRFTDASKKLSDIERMRDELRDFFYSLVKPVLGEQEIRVLEIIASRTNGNDSEWLGSLDLMESCERELKIESSEARAIIEKLVTQGLLKSGISLSV